MTSINSLGIRCVYSCLFRPDQRLLITIVVSSHPELTTVYFLIEWGPVVHPLVATRSLKSTLSVPAAALLSDTNRGIVELRIADCWTPSTSAPCWSQVVILDTQLMRHTGRLIVDWEI